MTGDPLKKVQPGQRLDIPAEAYNAFIDSIRASRGHQSLGSEFPRGNSALHIVHAKNVSGGNIQRFGITRLDGVLAEPEIDLELFKNTPLVLKAISPDSHFPFAVAVEPIADGAIGRVLIVGVVQVQVELVHPTHRFARPFAGDKTKLRSDSYGAPILYRPDEDGTAWCVIAIDLPENFRLVRFQLTSEIVECMDGTGVIIPDLAVDEDDDCQCRPGPPIVLIDRVGLCRQRWHPSGFHYSPIGAMGFAQPYRCDGSTEVGSNWYEIVSIGHGCCNGSTSSSESTGSSTGSSSTGSSSTRSSSTSNIARSSDHGDNQPASPSRRGRASGTADDH